MAESRDEFELRRASEHVARRRQRERYPKSSAQLISQLIARRGFSQTQWHDELQAAWLHVVDAELADKTRATIIKRGTLEIIASSSAAMQQLAFAKSTLLKRLQERLPAAGIRALRFRTGNIR